MFSRQQMDKTLPGMGLSPVPQTMYGGLMRCVLKQRPETRKTAAQTFLPSRGLVPPGRAALLQQADEAPASGDRARHDTLTEPGWGHDFSRIRLHADTGVGEIRPGIAHTGQPDFWTLGRWWVCLAIPVSDNVDRWPTEGPVRTGGRPGRRTGYGHTRSQG